MPYLRPPITEAVLELRFAVSISQNVIEATARRLKSNYLDHEPQHVQQIHVNADQKTSEFKEPEWLGIKLSTADRADVLLLQKQSFLCSRLAPYLGWEYLKARAMHDWEAWKKSVGSVEVARIGLRYINRIDVPIATQDQVVRVQDYLNFWPHSPETLDQPMQAYTIQVSSSLGVDECTLNLTSSSVPSPLIGYVSFVLDLDIYRQTNIPRREDALWELIDRMRQYKNRIFESTITEKSRSLFDA